MIMVAYLIMCAIEQRGQRWRRVLAGMRVAACIDSMIFINVVNALLCIWRTAMTVSVYYRMWSSIATYDREAFQSRHCAATELSIAATATSDTKY